MRDLARITDEIASQVEARAGEMLHRISPEGRRQRQRARARRRAAALRTMRRLLLAAMAVVLALVAWAAIVGPIGLGGIMYGGAAVFLAWGAIIMLAGSPPPSPKEVAASDLPLLPQRTEEWLERQRPALPAPTARLVDGIGLRLDALAPQLATLDAREPVAAELRKLLGEELPELIEGYRRVPEALRRQGRDGPSPDRQLLEGLGLVDTELARMTEQLASGDLHRLATQGRYLELKYKSGDEIGR